MLHFDFIVSVNVVYAARLCDRSTRWFEWVYMVMNLRVCLSDTNLFQANNPHKIICIDFYTSNTRHFEYYWVSTGSGRSPVNLQSSISI